MWINSIEILTVYALIAPHKYNNYCLKAHIWGKIQFENKILYLSFEILIAITSFSKNRYEYTALSRLHWCHGMDYVPKKYRILTDGTDISIPANNLTSKNPLKTTLVIKICQPIR